jgi:hypothetical protein
MIFNTLIKIIMDSVIRTYLWAAILIAIIFFIFSSNFLYWVTNRISTGLYGPTLFSYSQGGPTLSGIVVHSILFFGLIFGIVDYIYSELNGDDDKNVNIN